MAVGGRTVSFLWGICPLGYTAVIWLSGIFKKDKKEAWIRGLGNEGKYDQDIVHIQNYPLSSSFLPFLPFSKKYFHLFFLWRQPVRLYVCHLVFRILSLLYPLYLQFLTDTMKNLLSVVREGLKHSPAWWLLRWLWPSLICFSGLL